jgi:hypothetical protein
MPTHTHSLAQHHHSWEIGQVGEHLVTGALRIALSGGSLGQIR